ncbi:hypothetical protein, conserved [Trypanosoma brucei gambiense DAL972]|uniref:Uncharacterized protein n=1 Tax=Trypanosoma brucei gambiense (strain MHOM/CI/86/DAL972) TaxID=679716 RepID=D0A780_TRYB9|nr:hypothetical protein, conserved [Trypanosoma brucei gambiense DAL972]CBH17531.1 hypothetical protein, conserved [Trypanosoma brucei gambiense DAL972]|eukprot:XP_011779795.1 hypothetical protein, conserved [Trypanosoma brucei gambiense DAL972]
MVRSQSRPFSSGKRGVGQQQQQQQKQQQAQQQQVQPQQQQQQQHQEQQQQQQQPTLTEQKDKVVALSSSSSDVSVSAVTEYKTGEETVSSPKPSPGIVNHAEGPQNWREQLFLRNFPTGETAQQHAKGHSPKRRKSVNSFSTIGRRGSFVLSHTVTPRKKPLESQEEQLETYRSLQDRQFVSVHEELQHLRVMYTNLQKVVSRKNEEIEKLHQEVVTKTKEIERLNGLVDKLSKRRGNSTGSALDEGRAASARGSRPSFSPSLALYAKGASEDKLSNKVNGAGGAPAKMLLELRQNVASRDTIIDNLRMELHSAQHEKKESESKANKLGTELEDAKAQVTKLRSDLTTRDAVIEDMQRRLVSLPETTVGSSSQGLYRTPNSSNNSGPPTKQPMLHELGGNCLASNGALEHMRHDSQQLGGAGTLPYKSALCPGTQHQDLESAFRLELEHLRRCLEREKDTNSELEKHWRRRQEVEKRMAEVELNTARAEAEAFRRELTRLQQQQAMSNFAENQLQTARSENDVLQQRVQELREENAAQASREMELRNNVRLLRETCERHEEEVETLHRRMKVMKDNEIRLQEDIDILEEKLSRAERMRAAEQNGNNSLSCDIGSYVSLMSLNEKLQRRTEELEEQIRKMEECHAATPHDDFKKECGQEHVFTTPDVEAGAIGGISPASLDSQGGVIEFLTPPVSTGGGDAAACSTHEAGDSMICNGQAVGGSRKSVNNLPLEVKETTDVSTVVQQLQDELQGVRDRLRVTESELAMLREKQALSEERVRETVKRKVTSLRAAREEATRCWEMLRQQEVLVKRLQKQCEYQREIIESRDPPLLGPMRLSTQASAPTVCAPTTCIETKDGNTANETSREDKLIEEALRWESMRLDEEMKLLRQKLRRTVEERDHWKYLATGNSGEII